MREASSFLRVTILFCTTLVSLAVCSAQQESQPNSQLHGRRTFVSSEGVFRFTYPPRCVLNTDKNNAGATYIPVCSEGSACVVLPHSAYEGTNLEAASFQEREISDATTERACLTSPMRTEDIPEFSVPAKEPRRIINGVGFLHGVSSGVAAGHSIATDLYRAFHKGRCYELSINIGLVSLGAFDPGTIKEFSDKRVENELTTILDSFRFLK